MSISLPFTIPLWPAGHPSSRGKTPPTLTIYRASPEYRTGQFVIICPGGGYRHLSIDKEGHRPAQWLASQGISAGVLTYRLAPNRYPAPQEDLRRAVRLVRAHSKEWEIEIAQIGVLGFSAGGHLAGSVALLPPSSKTSAKDFIDAEPSTLDFAALIYPVVALTGTYAHPGSREALLGEEAPEETAHSLSLQNLVSNQKTAFFLFHGGSDKGVPPQNSLLLYNALQTQGISADLHIEHPIPHGVGLADHLNWGKQLVQWIERLKQ